MDSNREAYNYGVGVRGGFPGAQQQKPQSRLDNVNFESDDFGEDDYEDFRHPRRNPQVQPRFFNPELAATVANTTTTSNNNNYSNNASNNPNYGGSVWRPQQQQQQQQQQPYAHRTDFGNITDRYEDENVYDNEYVRGGGGGRDRGGGGVGDAGRQQQQNPREDDDMEASHPRPPKYDYVSHNKEDYGKAPPKSYKQISVIQKEEKEKLNDVFIQPKPKGGGILKKNKRQTGRNGADPQDSSRQGSLYSADGSYLDDDQGDQIPESAGGMSAAEQVSFKDSVLKRDCWCYNSRM